MPLRKAKGNMYKWVTHVHSHLRGGCPHDCSYCYVKSFRTKKLWTGPTRLEDKELNCRYGDNRTIFVEHCNDMFAADIPNCWIEKILDHCKSYPRNAYVFQTKNPERVLEWEMPKFSIIGTTIESNRHYPKYMGNAPEPKKRAAAMNKLKEQTDYPLFVTLEPILDFDVIQFVNWITWFEPDFINIGADSKGHKLPEPETEKVRQLIDWLETNGYDVMLKDNLQRLTE